MAIIRIIRAGNRGSRLENRGVRHRDLLATRALHRIGPVSDCLADRAGCSGRVAGYMPAFADRTGGRPRRGADGGRHSVIFIGIGHGFRGGWNLGPRIFHGWIVPSGSFPWRPPSPVCADPLLFPQTLDHLMH